MSKSDAGSDSTGTEGADNAPRPVTAAARRERRSSARPAGKEATGGGRAATRAARAAESATKPDGKNRATPKRTRKEKKPSWVSRLVRFIREVWAELLKVIWPTRKQMVTYTAVVLVFVAFMIALVSGLDFVFHKAVFWLFG